MRDQPSRCLHNCGVTLSSPYVRHPTVDDYMATVDELAKRRREVRERDAEIERLQCILDPIDDVLRDACPDYEWTKDPRDVEGKPAFRVKALQVERDHFVEEKKRDRATIERLRGLLGEARSKVRLSSTGCVIPAVGEDLRDRIDAALKGGGDV